METSTLAAGHQRAELAAVRDIVAGHARIGTVITTRAEKFASEATSAKTLSSAASAAKTGISIVRDALGLSSQNPVINSTFNIHLAHGPGSPWNPEAVAKREAEQAAKQAEPVPVVDVETLAVETPKEPAQAAT